MHPLLERLFSKLPNGRGQDALRNLVHALLNPGIDFEVRRLSGPDGTRFTAESKNLHNKSISASGTTVMELDQKLKEAIFTAFDVSAYYRDYPMIDSPLLQHATHLRHATPVMTMRVSWKNKNQPI